jgi:hypothetical protein
LLCALGYADTLSFDAVLGLELGEEFSDRLQPSVLCIFEALADSLFGIGLGGYVELALASVGSIDRKSDLGHQMSHRTLAP